MVDREALRATFDSAATGYHLARPRYPEEILDAVVDYAGLTPPANVLEVGPATGIATIPMAERGYRVTGVELGRDLAEQARMNTKHLNGVSIVCASFEDWQPPRWGEFELVMAATAWHWLEPDTKYARAHRHLRPDGTLAYWSAIQVVPDDGDRFFVELQDVYDELGESLPVDHSFPKPGELPDERDVIAATGLFDQVQVRQFDWEISYDAGGYIALLDTFSGHITMGPAKRARLYGEIRRRLAKRPDGRLRRHWGAALHLARRAG